MQTNDIFTHLIWCGNVRQTKKPVNCKVNPVQFFQVRSKKNFCVASLCWWFLDLKTFLTFKISCQIWIETMLHFLTSRLGLQCTQLFFKFSCLILICAACGCCGMLNYFKSAKLCMCTRASTWFRYIYINCWLPVYRWSVMDKQVTSTPPPQHLEMGGSGYLYLHYKPPVDWEPAINVDMVNMYLYLSRFRAWKA